MKILVITAVLLSTLLAIVPKASESTEVIIALETLADKTKGYDQASSYINYFCLVTKKAIKENKRGWYSIAKDEYIQLKNDLNSEDLSRFKDAFLAFESVFYKYNGN